MDPIQLGGRTAYVYSVEWDASVGAYRIEYGARHGGRRQPYTWSDSNAEPDVAAAIIEAEATGATHYDVRPWSRDA